MKRSRKQKLLMGVAVLVALAGGTMAAVTAARPTPHPHPGPLAAAAGYLGVSSPQLKSELQSGKSLAQVASSTGGKSKAGLVDTLVASERARLSAALGSVRERVERQVDRTGGRVRPRGVGVVARYLGLRPVEVQRQRRAGRSLAQIADATGGKSATGLIEAIVSARKAKLAARVAAGKITPAQEQARLARLTKHVTAAVNRTKPPRARSSARG
jgi:hypothetical protein